MNGRYVLGIGYPIWGGTYIKLYKFAGGETNREVRIICPIEFDLETKYRLVLERVKEEIEK